MIRRFLRVYLGPRMIRRYEIIRKFLSFLLRVGFTPPKGVLVGWSKIVKIQLFREKSRNFGPNHVGGAGLRCVLRTWF